jgi:hypothetical protein
MNKTNGVLIAGVCASILVSSAFADDAPEIGEGVLVRPCFEDELVLWDGVTNAHTRCIPVDDYNGALIDCFVKDICDPYTWRP